MLTLEEQERLAYISGDTGRAALIAQAVDAGADETGEDVISLQELRETRDRAEEAEGDAEALREQIKSLGGVPCA